MLSVLMRSLVLAGAVACCWWPGPRPAPGRSKARRWRFLRAGDCWKLEVLIPPGTCDTLG